MQESQNGKVVANENPVFTGEKHDIICPSTKKVTIRQTNGDDDDLLSSIKDAKQDGANILNFLSNIIEIDHDLGRKPLPEDILNYKSRDKYYILFKQRIVNHGTELHFQVACDCDKCKGTIHNFEDDLSTFECDFTNPESKPANTAGFYPYKDRKEMMVYFDHPKGKHRFKHLTGVLESKTVDANKNAKLRVRELERETSPGSGEYLPVLHFGMYTSAEAGKLRNAVTEHDPDNNPETQIKFPCGITDYAPLFAIPTFFYPEETI